MTNNHIHATKENTWKRFSSKDKKAKGFLYDREFIFLEHKHKSLEKKMKKNSLLVFLLTVALIAASAFSALASSEERLLSKDGIAVNITVANDSGNENLQNLIQAFKQNGWIKKDNGKVICTITVEEKYIKFTPIKEVSGVVNKFCFYPSQLERDVFMDVVDYANRAAIKMHGPAYTFSRLTLERTGWQIELDKARNLKSAFGDNRHILVKHHDDQSAILSLSDNNTIIFKNRDVIKAYLDNGYEDSGVFPLEVTLPNGKTFTILGFYK